MSFKKAWFQLHWILGITAGLILMVVGVTGATLSFEKEILKVLNPDLVKVTPAKDAVALTPEALLQRIQQNHPDRKINGLTLSKDPYEAAKVNFAVEGEGRRARKGETRYVDPYNGTVRWEEEFGHEFMHTVESLHRRLLSGEVGKQIVGASTIALIILILSGLYLRWPKTWTSLKTWLTFNPRKTGRSFLSSLHAVAGTWALIFLLLASLTGLYWSYDWYRAGLYQISGVPQPVRGGPPKGAKNTEMAQGERKRPRRGARFRQTRESRRFTETEFCRSRSGLAGI
ncbi:PepSY-associated TM helix domain-containing protein [Thiomicrorhabdus sp.]|uniref:PepSY-associated TM helix domain-containing protein n=1 Tax=Thiomicrorhabdus sp. TaxID=2039724 RepID=UPI0029C6A46D|nr:PepSY-associated TM helix domain-containing protein [Thiomicrorhabdus sp.]